jgi:hypothetical protein
MVLVIASVRLAGGWPPQKHHDHLNVSWSLKTYQAKDRTHADASLIEAYSAFPSFRRSSIEPTFEKLTIGSRGGCGVTARLWPGVESEIRAVQGGA